MVNKYTASPDPRISPDGFGQVVGDTGETNSPSPDKFLEGVPSVRPSGMGEGFFLDAQERAQQSLGDTARDTINQSKANSALELLQTTPQVAEELLTTGTAELEPFREELTKDIPLHLHDNVMGAMTHAGALAKRSRILEDMEVSQRLAAQTGISSAAVQMAAGLLDVDLPLMFASGGTLAAAKTASNVARTTRALTGSTALSRIAGDTAVGVTGGALSGAIVGGVGSIVRDDMDVNGLFTHIMAGAVMGGVLNPAVNTISPDRLVWSQAARLEYESALKRIDTDLQRDLMDPDSAINNHGRPIDTADQAQGPVLIETGGSVSAASLNTSPRALDIEAELANLEFNKTARPEDGLRDVDPRVQALHDAGATPSIIRRSLESGEWKQDYDFDKIYAEDTANPFVRTLVGDQDFEVRIPLTDIKVNLGQIAGTVFTLGQRDFTTLVRSKAPSANFVAAEILESSSGLVRRGSSAAVLKEFYHSSAMVHSASAIIDTRAAYFRQHGLNPIKTESHRKFSRDLRLAMHKYGKTGQMPKGYEDVIKRIDKTHQEILGHMQGLDEARSVRGSREIEHQNGYFRYDWEPQHFLRVRQQAGEANMVQAFRDGYMRGSGFDKELAEKLARAEVRRFADRGLGVGAADSRLLDIDSRSGIEAVLEGSGLPAHEIESIRRRLDVNTQERVKKGFLKNRNELDLETTIPGTNLQLVDLMTDDLERSIQHYVGDAAGAASLANKGLRDEADISTLKDTILFEQSALGEAALTRDQIDAVFSQFTGGVHKGYMMRQQTSGVSPAVSMLTKATRASLLQRVGLTQLMDSANLFVANGVANTMEPILAKLGMNRPGMMTKDQLKHLHGELESIGAIVGRDHLLFRPHLSIDETEVANDVYMQMGQTALNSVERATNYASGQIHVTAAQQMVSAAAVSTNVMRSLSGQDTNLTNRMLRDIGLEPHHLSELLGHIQDGDIVVDGGRVELNPDKWSKELRHDFGAAVMRAVGQQVQKGFVGETSVWMNSDLGKLLSSLKTFALTAVQKQTARNLMIGGQQHFLRAAAYQLGFAYSVLSLGQAMQGQEMSAVDRGRLAVAYTPTMGTVPMVLDPITTMLGFDDLNFSPYGRYASYLDTPVFEQTQKLMRAPGSISDMLTGSGDYDDMQNARAMFFMNWYGMKQVWEAM